MRRAIFVLTLVAAMVFACAGVVLAQSTSPSDRTTADREQRSEGRAGDAIPDQYIVVLEDSVSDPRQTAQAHAQRHGAEVLNTYENALKGYAARIPAQALDRVRNDPDVRFVSKDHTVEASAETPDHSGKKPSDSGKKPSGGGSTTPGQTLPTGIDRIDSETSSTLAGNGTGSVATDVAIIDTGIDLDHPDLNVVGGENCQKGTTYDDGNGHGTHVAGTAAAKDDKVGVVGAAPGARLWAVRVLDNSGSGSWSSVICGIDWVTANSSTIKVANMSLGGWLDNNSDPDAGDDKNCGNTNADALHQAICGSEAAGVTYAVAAGNDDWEIYDGRWTAVPAAYDEVLAVTAVADGDGKPGGLKNPSCRTGEKDDYAATFSNFATKGTERDGRRWDDETHTIAAPGVCIRSTWKGGGYDTISGTSMASPHVAGVAALYLATNSTAKPADVISVLRTKALAQPNTYGFQGDTNSQNGSRYYGPLTYAKDY